MYKAGDFTNGKMNEIFKDASQSNVTHRSARRVGGVGAYISHKQLGDFVLIDEELLAVKSAFLYEVITGIKIEEFYSTHGDGSEEANKSQLKAVNELIFPCGTDNELGWSDAYFALSDRLAVVIAISGSSACSDYMGDISGNSDDK